MTLFLSLTAVFFNAILEAAGEDEVDRTLDPDDVFDMLVGAILYKIYAASLGNRMEAPDRTIDLILRLLRP